MKEKKKSMQKKVKKGVVVATTNLVFIKKLMTDPPRPLGTPPVREGELAQRRRQLMAIHKDADMNDIEFELAMDMNGL